MFYFLLLFGCVTGEAYTYAARGVWLRVWAKTVALGNLYTAAVAVCAWYSAFGSGLSFPAWLVISCVCVVAFQIVNLTLWVSALIPGTWFRRHLEEQFLLSFASDLTGITLLHFARMPELKSVQRMLRGMSRAVLPGEVAFGQTVLWCWTPFSRVGRVQVARGAAARAKSPKKKSELEIQETRMENISNKLKELIASHDGVAKAAAAAGPDLMDAVLKEVYQCAYEHVRVWRLFNVDVVIKFRSSWLFGLIFNSHIAYVYGVFWWMLSVFTGWGGLAMWIPLCKYVPLSSSAVFWITFVLVCSTLRWLLMWGADSGDLSIVAGALSQQCMYTIDLNADVFTSALGFKADGEGYADLDAGRSVRALVDSYINAMKTNFGMRQSEAADRFDRLMEKEIREVDKDEDEIEEDL